MADQVMVQLLRTVARLEAGAAPAIDENLAHEGVTRGYLVRWRSSYVRTALGKAYQWRASPPN